MAKQPTFAGTVADRLNQVDNMMNQTKSDLKTLIKQGKKDLQALQKQKKALRKGKGTTDDEKYASLLLMEEDTRKAVAWGESMLADMDGNDENESESD